MSEKTLEYNIAQAGSIYSLTLVVNEKIKDGWVPVGGIAVDHDVFTTNDEGDIATGATYLQAMVKHG